MKNSSSAIVNFGKKHMPANYAHEGKAVGLISIGEEKRRDGGGRSTSFALLTRSSGTQVEDPQMLLLAKKRRHLPLSTVDGVSSPELASLNELGAEFQAIFCKCLFLTRAGRLPKCVSWLEI